MKAILSIFLLAITLATGNDNLAKFTMGEFLDKDVEMPGLTHFRPAFYDPETATSRGFLIEFTPLKNGGFLWASVNGGKTWHKLGFRPGTRQDGTRYVFLPYGIGQALKAVDDGEASLGTLSFSNSRKPTVPCILFRVERL